MCIRDRYDIGRTCFLVGKAFAESAESLEKFPTFFTLASTALNRLSLRRLSKSVSLSLIHILPSAALCSKMRKILFKFAAGWRVWTILLLM